MPLAELEGETAKWCRRILQNSPTAIACLKAALNTDEDGAAGVQVGGGGGAVRTVIGVCGQARMHFF